MIETVGETKKIQEKITPRGDGNFFKFYGIILLFYIIREKITLRGDGNF